MSASTHEPTKKITESQVGGREVVGPGALRGSPQSNWDEVPLMQLCSPKQWPTISGGDLTPSGFPVFGANGQIGFYGEYNHEYPTLLVTCRGATCGAVNICAPRSYVTGNAMALDDLDARRADLRFMYHALVIRGFQDTITGTAQPQITRDSLRRVTIRLPPLPEQRRIADILDKADAIRRKRKEAIALTEELLRSAFLDMFGDPVTNPKGWPVRSFKQLLAMPLRNGLSPASAGVHPARVLMLSAITGRSYDAAASKDGMFAVEPWDDVRIDARDFLICRGNGNKEFVGRGMFPTRSDRSLVFPDTMIAARIDADVILPAFLAAAWKSPDIRRQLEAGARTTNGTFKINQTVVESIQLVCPPRSVQEPFQTLVLSTSQTQLRCHEASVTSDLLFQALVNRAFQGDPLVGEDRC